MSKVVGIWEQCRIRRGGRHLGRDTGAERGAQPGLPRVATAARRRRDRVRRRRLGGQHRAGGARTVAQRCSPAADPQGQGQCAGVWIRRRLGRHRRDDRRRRQHRPPRKSRASSARSSRARTSPRVHVSSRAAAAVTSPACGAWATGGSTRWSTRSSPPSTPISATGTTLSGATASR